MESKVQLALRFATLAHEGVNRPFGGAPYITHPVKVARLAWDLFRDEDMTCAALMHDVPEDVGLEKIVGIARLLGFDADEDPVASFPENRRAKLRVLALVLGERVAHLVECVTKVTTKADGERVARMPLELAHLALADAGGQDLKLMDMLINMRDAADAPPKFLKRWMKEKAQTLAVLDKGNALLREEVRACLNRFELEKETT